MPYAGLSPCCNTIDPKCCPTVCSSRGVCLGMSSVHFLGISFVKLTSVGPSAYDLVNSPLVRLRDPMQGDSRLDSRRGSLEENIIASSSYQWRIHGPERFADIVAGAPAPNVEILYSALECGDIPPKCRLFCGARQGSQRPFIGRKGFSFSLVLPRTLMVIIEDSDLLVYCTAAVGVLC